MTTGEKRAVHARVGRSFGVAPALAVLWLTALWPTGPSGALADERVFTVAKYPIEAEAESAVVAKREAMVDGQRGAFHALLKRLVPVTAYKRLPNPKPGDIDAMTRGLNVRSEQNSRTEYLAEIDFRYDPDQVRQYLRRQRLPFLERQAPEVLLVPVYRNANTAAPRYLANAGGQRAWRQAWAELDLDNTLTPVRLAQVKLEIRDDVRRGLADGDLSMLRIFQREYGAERFILASAEPDPTGRRLIVSIAGQDAVGAFHLKRTYPIEDEDLLYSAELATIIGLGILEGRWKAVAADSNSLVAAAGPAEDIVFYVRYAGFGQWQGLRQRLANLPGVETFDTGTVSARGAEVRMRYAGGLTALRQRLARDGLPMGQEGNAWVVNAN